jgi:hypothetical protein
LSLIHICCHSFFFPCLIFKNFVDINIFRTLIMPIYLNSRSFHRPSMRYLMDSYAVILSIIWNFWCCHSKRMLTHLLLEIFSRLNNIYIETLPKSQSFRICHIVEYTKGKEISHGATKYDCQEMKISDSSKRRITPCIGLLVVICNQLWTLQMMFIKHNVI